MYNIIAWLRGATLDQTPVSLAQPLPISPTVGGAAISAASPLPVADTPRIIDAAFTMLTRPANTTAYSANDSISNSATIGSVTALVATASDVNDAPLALTHVKLETTDTGLGGVQVRAWVYRSDPTANSGVQGGDNAAFSNKMAGLVGTFTGTMRAMQDGASGNLQAEDASHYETVPESGGQRLWIQYQAVGGFTPSANSTTLTGRIKGFQGRA